MAKATYTKDEMFMQTLRERVTAAERRHRDLSANLVDGGDADWIQAMAVCAIAEELRVLRVVGVALIEEEYAQRLNPNHRGL